MEVSICYLVTGVTVIAKLTAPDSDGFIGFKDPMELHVRSAGKEAHGGVRVAAAFSAYGSMGGALPAIKETVIHVSHFMHPPVVAPKQITDAYLSATSGIHLV